MSESLLVLSDVHLGCDVDDLAPEQHRTRRPASIDQRLAELIDHYRTAPSPGSRWRLVFAGDLIDFLGMTVVDSDARATTTLTDEERVHGLGSSSDHVCIKLERVAARHREVFDAMRAFVEAGNAITVVLGNHDVELHWEAVKERFRQLVSPVVADRTRIEFTDWFFYREGLAYIEHGHQYDPFCATENYMAPLSPADPTRTNAGFCSVLSRHIVKPTRGLHEQGHNTLGVFDYVLFGLRLGLREMMRLGLRFGQAVHTLVRAQIALRSKAARNVKATHLRRLKQFAGSVRMSHKRVRQIVALQSQPVTRTIRAILQSLLLDRIALGVSMAGLVAMVALLGLLWSPLYLVAGGLFAAWFGADRWLASQRDLEAADQVLIERAHRLAALVPAAFIVMGHTHTPRQIALNEGKSTYFNLGSWSEVVDVDGSSLELATRTHLVIHTAENGPVAELRVWHPTGPETYRAA